MLNVHRGLPRKFDDLPLWAKLLIVGTFPVWGPLAVVGIFLSIFVVVAVTAYEDLFRLFDVLRSK